MMNVIAFSSVFASLGGTSRAILASRQRFRHLAALYFAAEVITFVCVMGLLLGGFGAPGVVIAKAVGDALTGIVSWRLPIGFVRRMA